MLLVVGCGVVCLVWGVGCWWCVDMCICVINKLDQGADGRADLEHGEGPEDDVARLVRHRQHRARRRLLVACVDVCVWSDDDVSCGALHLLRVPNRGAASRSI